MGYSPNDTAPAGLKFALLVLGFLLLFVLIVAADHIGFDAAMERARPAAERARDHLQALWDEVQARL